MKNLRTCESSWGHFLSWFSGFQRIRFRFARRAREALGGLRRSVGNSVRFELEGRRRRVSIFSWQTKARWWFQICLFSPLFVQDSHFDEHIFQRGWNQQLEGHWLSKNNLHPLPMVEPFRGKTKWGNTSALKVIAILMWWAHLWESKVWYVKCRNLLPKIHPLFGLYPWKLTWQAGFFSVSIGNTSSNGGFSSLSC